MPQLALWARLCRDLSESSFLCLGGLAVIKYTRAKEGVIKHTTHDPYLCSCQQVVAKENAQRAAHFKVLVSRENPVKFLCHALQDVILILNTEVNTATGSGTGCIYIYSRNKLTLNDGDH